MTIEEAVGLLNAHEERLKGQNKNQESQLLLGKEEWEMKESGESKLLLTRKEWIKKWKL